MNDRRHLPRVSTPIGNRGVTLHGSAGRVSGRLEDESVTGLGVRVSSVDGIELGGMVLLHRPHQFEVHLGQVRYIRRVGSEGYRVGIHLLDTPAPSASPNREVLSSV